MDKCPTCGEFTWSRFHKCDPSFYIWDKDYDFADVYESKYHLFRGRDEEQAAERFGLSDFENPSRMEVYVIAEKDANNLIAENADDDDEYLITQKAKDAIIEKAFRFDIDIEVVPSASVHRVKKPKTENKSSDATNS